MDLTTTQIATDRLRLLPITTAYREIIFREFQEPVTRYMFPKAPERIEETDAFIAASRKCLKDGTHLQTVVIKKDNDEFLGCAGLHHLDKATPELGIWIKHSAHGHGYGREAVAALKQWADEHLPYTHLRYPVVEENIASRKIPESLGGKAAKRYRKTMRSGRTYDMVEYWLTK